jgi:hypothetical protein
MRSQPPGRISSTQRPDPCHRRQTPSLFGEPRRIIDKDEAIELLTATLPDLDTGEVRDRLSSRKGFVWLKREITPKQQQDIHRLGIPGIGFLRENKRSPDRLRSRAPDRSREHRQPGHRRDGEMAGQ